MRFRRTRRVFRWAIRAILAIVAVGIIAAIVFSFRCRAPGLRFQPSSESERHPEQANGVAHYTRPEEDTFYSYPEWYIVWSYQAKADFQRTRLPSHYTYFADIAQYWRNYCCVFSIARKKYPVAWPEHVMLVVIGTSFSVEYALKGAYENTFGRLSEWSSHHQLTAEDGYAADIAEDYARFVHIRPFYEYSFARALGGLWRQVPLRGEHWVRKTERRGWLTLDYGVEAIYCELIQLSTHATYGYEDTTTSAWVTASSPPAFATIPHLRVLKDLGSGSYIVEFPRYQEFTARSLDSVHSGITFVQIAGNHNILVSIIADHPFSSPAGAEMVRSNAIPSEPGRSRVALLCQVKDLSAVLRELENQAVTIEHIYDY